MIKVDSSNKTRVDIIDALNSINQYQNMKNQDDKEKSSKYKIVKKSNKDIYSTIRAKAAIMNSDNRDIQDIISIIQAKELEVDDIEKVLKHTKDEYIRAIESGKREEIRHKIKIRQLSKQVNDPKNQLITGESQGNIIYKEVDLQSEENTVAKINDILSRINRIKGRLSQYKSEFMSLGEDVDDNKRRIAVYEKDLELHLDDADYIIDGISIRNSNYVDLSGNIYNGLIIDIYI